MRFEVDSLMDVWFKRRARTFSEWITSRTRATAKMEYLGGGEFVATHKEKRERERKNVHDQNDGAGRRSISIWWKTFHSAGTYANQRHLRSADAWRWAAYWRAESLNPPASSGTRKYLKIIPSINIWFTLLLKWMNDEVMAQYHFKFTKPWIWTYQER